MKNNARCFMCEYLVATSLQLFTCECLVARWDVGRGPGSRVDFITCINMIKHTVRQSVCIVRDFRASAHLVSPAWVAFEGVP